MNSSINTGKVLVTTVILSFVFIITLIVLIILNKNKDHQFWKNEEIQGHSTELSDTERLQDAFCISCNYFGQSVKQNDTLYDFVKQGTCNERRLCCVKNQKYIQKLIEKISLPDTSVDKSEVENITESFRWWRQRQHSAHLYLNTSSLKDGSLQWVTSDKFGTAYMNGVSLFGSKLHVENQGHYFIYTAVSFNYETEQRVETFYQTVTKEHRHFPNTGPQIILMDKYGGSSKLNKRYTSFLCGTFYLQSGHEIDTTVSEKRFISSSPYASYFGMYRL